MGDFAFFVCSLVIVIRNNISYAICYNVRYSIRYTIHYVMRYIVPIILYALLFALRACPESRRYITIQRLT